MNPMQDGAQWYCSMIEGMADGVIATDKQGIVHLINPAAENLIGVSSKEALGKPLKDVFRLADPGTRIPTPRSFHKLRHPRFFNRVLLLARSGEKKVIDAVVSPVEIHKGSVSGSVLIIRDISKTVTMERVTLDRQKMEAIGNMARGIGLDFNNWLSVISGHASAIMDNLIPNTRAHEEATRILRASEQAGGLTQRLLGIAKASNARGENKIENVDLGEVIRNAINLVESTFAEEKISFRARNLDSMPFVLADSAQLFDCLMNMFSNAKDSMPNGGTITVDVSEKTEGKKRFAVIRIRDTGVGMTKEVLDHIFEPFFTTKKTETAIGLGLTVVQSSLDQWGGYVKVRSEPGQGTSFRLFVPRGEAHPAKSQPRLHGSGRETILLVDDRKDARDSAKRILEQAGYKVIEASNGEECIDIFRKLGAQISLLLVDVVMPGKDGKKVLEDILDTDPAALIVMTSGFSREYVRGYIERGVWGFVQKPFDGNQLLSSVRRVLDQKTARMKTGI